jgi:hypothetical protein
MTNPIFTFHSAERLMERGITRDHILAAVNYGQRTQGREEGTDVYALERMRVVVARESNVIVTAWRENKHNPKRNMRKARKESKKHKRRWG